MEAGFFSEERCSSFISQATDLDDDDGSIFDKLTSMAMPFDSFSTLMEHMDDENVIYGGNSGCGESTVRENRKEDFHKMLNDWQEHLSSLQVLDGDKLMSDMPDIFSTLPSQPTDGMDALFLDYPIEIKEEPECEDDIKPIVIVNEDSKEEGELHSDGEDDKTDETSNKCSLVKIKNENDDESVDVETVGEKMPVLEAGDVKTLLEQFEASEAVNTSCNEADKQSNMTHQNIRDALPKEVIARIKASTRKKAISLIPAMPTKKSVRAATRMQDAAVTLSRNKLLKLVSNGGESVQLDHDYCSGTGASEGLVPPPNNFYQTDVTDYSSGSYSRLPDYFVTVTPQKAHEPKRNKDWTEKNSKKDSGLESGDVSDASEEVPPPPPPRPPLTKTVSMVSVLKKNNLPQNSLPNNSTTTTTVSATTVSVHSLKMSSSLSSSSCNSSNDSGNSSSSNCSQIPTSGPTNTETINAAITSTSEPVRKKKLNLEEYRSRREERERIRSAEGSRTCSPDLSDSLQNNTNTKTPVAKEVEEGEKNEQSLKLMHSVEVQATPEDMQVDNSRSRTKHKTSHETSRRRREYRTRHISSSSSSSSSASRRSKHRSSRRVRKISSSEKRSSTVSQSRKRSVWSRSPSSSSHSGCSTCTRSRSRSRSRSRHSDSRRSGGGKWGKRSLWRTRNRFHKSSYSSRDTWKHQRSSSRVSGSSGGRGDNSQNSIEWSDKEKLRQVEERRVIYVGRIEEGTTKAHLRERFGVFGPIIDISVHFREHGDNYGFVTFAYKVDAYEAVEHGNDDPLLPRYDLSFGGRRAFCKQRYADLDGERLNSTYRSLPPAHRPDASFDLLLREAQAHLNKRSSV